MSLTNQDLVDLVAFRRQLHQAPEISNEEYETAKAVEAFLAQTGPDEILTGFGGPGLAAIYDFLLSEGRPACPTIGDATDRPAAVAASGHATCQEALGVFLEIYGAEAGNVALTVLADGGVFLAGGIAPKLLADPARQELLRGWFVRQGRFRDYLEGIPLAVVTEPNLGLLGAALAVHPRA